jgi:hypothetical protein
MREIISHTSALLNRGETPTVGHVGHIEPAALLHVGHTGDSLLVHAFITSTPDGRANPLSEPVDSMLRIQPADVETLRRQMPADR